MRRCIPSRWDGRAAAELSQLTADSLGYLPGVIFLGRYGQGDELDVGKPYDLRFLENRLAVLPCSQTNALVELPYGDVETVDIGGPGLVRSSGVPGRGTRQAGIDAGQRPADTRGIRSAESKADLRIVTVSQIRNPLSAGG
jgi:hypothetical protein